MRHLLGDQADRHAAAVSRGRQPIIKLQESQFTPALYNDPDLTKKTTALFRKHFGDANVVVTPPVMGGEDFSRYGKAGVPIFYWFLGTIDDARFAESRKPGARPLPSMHSDLFYPTYGPSIRHGVASMTLAVMNVLKK